MYRTKDFDYHLPAELIAQHPHQARDKSRLMVYDRFSGEIDHREFNNLLELLRPGDVLVANDSRVIPARLFGLKVETGGKVEFLLLEKLEPSLWQALVGGKRIKVGTDIQLVDRSGNQTQITGKIISELEGAKREVRFNKPIEPILHQLGHIPLPPYIHIPLKDPERYQTVFSRHEGSAAAPTAGLHFTGDTLLSLRNKGILFETITLHVGLDTFNPVKANLVSDHLIHSEWARLSMDTARRINQAKLAGGRVVAVGTTAVRVLETASLRSAGITGSLADISYRDREGETFDICPWKPVVAFEGRTDLYIYPGYRFRVVDAMITNFHLPQSTLIMLVSAFTQPQSILDAYNIAIKQGYRFYSFGDAMFIQ